MTREIGTVTREEVEQWPVRLALFDIDGTLVHGTNTIPEQVIEEISRAQRAGVKIGLATGRPYFSARWVAERLASDLPGMFCSGSLICRPLSGEVLFADYLRAEETVLFLERVKSEGFYVELYTRDHYYIEAQNEFSAAHEKYMNVAAIVDSFNQTALRPDLLKIVIMVKRGEREDRLRQIMREFPQYAAGISAGEADPDILFFNLTNSSASREHAFNLLLAHHQLNADQVAAFGDAESDIAFLSLSRYGVAMGNASSLVKQKAPFVTSDVKIAGVAEALKALIP